MSYRVISFEPTPNPDALKCILDRPVSDRPRSFLRAADAADDPLARALFEIEGVRCVLMNGGWVTVNKRPDAPWPPIRKAVRAALRSAS